MHPLKIKMTEFLKTKKKILLPVLLVTFLSAAVFTYFLFLFRDKKMNATPGSVNPTSEVLPTRDPTKKGQTYNFLLLGYGGAGHDGGNLSDVIMVLHVDASGRATFISIPRDLWADMPIRSDKRQNFKINAAYAIGGDDRTYPLKEPQYKGEKGAGAMAKKVVSEVTGLNMEYFVAIDFESFKKIVDILGGLKVEVPVTFDDYFYPIKGEENNICGKSSAEIARLHSQYSDTALHHQFECRYEHIHFDKGSADMNGDMALKFVRSRASAQHGGDFARSQRQQAVLYAMKDKLISFYAVKKIEDIYSEFKNLIRTDMSLDAAKKLAQVLGSPKDYGVRSINLSTENVLVSTKSLDGQFILIPKEGENIWSGVQKYIYEEIQK